MTKIDIISGFLGAGKTTLIKKMISEGKKWLHFGLDWEDAYVIKHSQTILK